MTVTRTRAAQYLAEQLGEGRAQALRRTAAWLIRTGRTRELSYLARDVAQAALNNGTLYAVVTSAQSLSPESKRTITNFLERATQAHTIEVEYRLDPGVIGGVYLDLPNAHLDATLRTRLNHFAKGITHE